MKLLDDTSPEARKVLIECYRRMSPARKWRLLDDAYRTIRDLHASGCRLRNPAATPQQIHCDWIRHLMGKDWAPCLLEERTVNLQSPGQQAVIRHVVSVFQKLGITYAVGGGLASSIHGANRSTEGADIAAEPFPAREAEFATNLAADYYVDVPMIQQANRDRSSFNMIHFGTGFKIDVFIRKDRPFDLSVFSRRIATIPDQSTGQSIDIVSPEDTILQKLEWFRLGGEISDKQWSDILGVLRVQAGRLDESYLDYWAKELGVFDLLEEIRTQV
jgi:hypothetical protein